MWSVSDRFLAALRGPHEMVTTVDILDEGVIVEGDIPVAGGTLTRDRRAATYGRVSLVVNDPDLAPITGNATLGPAGYELAVYRGVRFSDGTTETVPLGIFPIQEATVDGVSMTTSIEAVDRSQRMADALLEEDYSWSAGHLPGLALVALALEVIPDIEFVASYTIDAGGLVIYEAGSDRWAIMQDIVRGTGGELFFDGLGRLVVRIEPDVSGQSPVWEIDEGDTGVLLSVNLNWSRRPSYNRAIVTGTNQEFDVIYRGTATDNAPNSPSYYSGRFGPKPIFYESPHVNSTASARAAARAIVLAKRGVAMSMDLSAVPNCALESGDVVLVRREALGLDTPVVVDSLTIGLGPEDAMTATVRARQEDEIEEV